MSIRNSATLQPWAGGWRRKLLLFGCLLGAGVLWGVIPAISRVAMSGGASAIGLTLWQGLGGGGVLLAATLLRGRRLPLSPRHIVFYGICGLTGTAVPTALIFAAAPRMPVGMLSMLIAAGPLITYAIAISLKIDRLSTVRLLGLALGMVAIALIVGPIDEVASFAVRIWVFLALLVPLCYAVENIYVALFRPPGVDAMTLLTGMLLLGGLAVIPVVWWTDGFVALSIPFGVEEWATIAIIVLNIASYWAFLVLIQLAGPVFAAQVGYLSMLTGVVCGVIAYDERLPTWAWVGGALMIAGLVLVRERPVGR